MRGLPQQRSLGGGGLAGKRLQAQRGIQVGAQRARVDGRLHLLRMLAQPDGACTLANGTSLCSMTMQASMQRSVQAHGLACRAPE